MAKPSDHPGFKALLAEWDQKLYDSGFRDAERPVGKDRVLKKSGASRRYEWSDQLTREARETYYALVAQKFMETHFKKECERQILELYAQGFSQAAIKKELDISGNRSRIYKPIYKWLRAWGLK